MAAVTKASGFMNSLRRWAFKSSGYNKYGLFYDDLLNETEDVSEALKRVPQKVIDERNYRMVRACQLSLQKIYLPEDQWTNYDEDRNFRYLSPIVEQVKKEREEREKWNSMF